MADKPSWAWVPNALTGSRIVLTALTWAAALQGNLAAFVVLVLLIVLTDILDGPMARRLGVANPTGANMDSFADLTFYLSLPAWAYLWRPEDILEHIVPILVLGTLYLGALVLTRLRWGQLGLHNRSARTAGTAGVLFALWTILWGWVDLLAVLIVAIVVLDLGVRFRRLTSSTSDHPHRPAGMPQDD